MLRKLNQLRFRWNALRDELDNRRPAGRRVVARETDHWIVSYPKSGNTWTRFLVAHLINPGTTVDYESIRRQVPDIYQESELQLAALPSPRTLKSHEYFDPRYGNVVYIVRDPRDVAVSYFHHHIKTRQIDAGESIETFCDRFVSGTLDGYGSWGENVGSWLGARQHDTLPFLLIRYEDLLAEPLRELSRLASHLHANAEEDFLNEVIARSSFGEMQRLEKQTREAFPDSRQDLTFARKGKSGTWKDELPTAAARCIADRWGNLMDTLGYAR